MIVAFDGDQMWACLIWNHDLEEKKTVSDWFSTGVKEATAEVMRVHNVTMKAPKSEEGSKKVELADFLSILANKKMEVTSKVEMEAEGEAVQITDFKEVDNDTP